jgi:hypothetical protein
VTGMVALLFNTLVAGFGSLSTYFLYYAILSFAAIFFVFLIPETAGKDLEDIAALFSLSGKGDKQTTSSKPIDNPMHNEEGYSLMDD